MTAWRLSITLEAATLTRSSSFDCLVSLDAVGDVVGVAIPSFRRQLDAALLQSATSRLPRWAYDKDTDALYVKIKNAVCTRQRKKRGVAACDCNGVIVRFDVLLFP